MNAATRLQSRRVDPRSLRWVAVLALSFVSAAPVFAAHPEGVTLYEHSHFRGLGETFDRDDARLHNNEIGADRASSIRVPPGCTATLYQDDGFQGRYVVLHADRADLSTTWVGNDAVSSLEVACPRDPPAGPGVTLFEHSRFRGRSETFHRDDPRLHNNRIGQDQASSVKVPPGCTVTLYRDDAYRGPYAVLRADSADLGETWVGNDTVSSLAVSCRSGEAAASLPCESSGAFVGTFTGDDSGLFLLVIDAATGGVTALAETLGAGNGEPEWFSGKASRAYDRETLLVTGSGSGELSFSGRSTDPKGISGTWRDPETAAAGTFAGLRIGAAADAAYRFTGTFRGDDFGVFALDVDRRDKVTLLGYSLAEEEMGMLTGRVTGTSLRVDGDALKVTGTLERSRGTLEGSWKNGEDGSSGTLSGTGCELQPESGPR